jgi:hypothetical protein
MKKNHDNLNNLHNQILSFQQFGYAIVVYLFSDGDRERKQGGLVNLFFCIIFVLLPYIYYIFFFLYFNEVIISAITTIEL